MLVLSRKQQEAIKIGDGITIEIIRIGKNTVKIGIEAPKELRVIRGELKEQPAKGSEPCVSESAPSVDPGNATKNTESREAA